MTVCAKATLSYNLYISETYGLFCHSNTRLKYLKSILEKDLKDANKDCNKEKEPCIKSSPISLLNNICSTC